MRRTARSNGKRRKGVEQKEGISPKLDDDSLVQDDALPGGTHPLFKSFDV
jgi:hypothetical protein